MITDPLRPPETDLDRIVWLVPPDSPDLGLLERRPYTVAVLVVAALLALCVAALAIGRTNR